MDWLAFWAAVIGHVAWPIAVLILGFTFQRQVRALLEKLTHLKGPGGIEADFSREVEKVAAQAEVIYKLPHHGASGDSTVLIASDVDADHIPFSLIKDRPSALILDSWSRVEKAMLAVIDKKGIYVSEKAHMNPLQWIYELERNGVIGPETANLLHEMRDLRNHVAHAREFEPTTKDAVNFYVSAERVITVLNGALENK